MKNKWKYVVAVLGVILLAVVVSAGIIYLLDGHKAYRVIKVEDHRGDVTYERNEKEHDISDKMNLISKDVVTTGSGANLELLADADKHIAAEENTCFSIEASGSEKSGKIKIVMQYGEALYTIENPLNEKSEFEVETPNATLSVRGTIFRVIYDPDTNTTTLEVLEGKVKVKTKKEEMTVKAGESVIVVDDAIKDAEEEDTDASADESGTEQEEPQDQEELSEQEETPEQQTEQVVYGQAISELPTEEKNLKFWKDGPPETYYIVIAPNGSFCDGWMGKTWATVRSGHCAEIIQVNATTYKLTVGEADANYVMVGFDTVTETGKRYSLSEGKEILLYYPGTPLTDLPDGFMERIMAYYDNSKFIQGDTLNSCVCYLEEYDAFYFQTQASSLDEFCEGKL